MIDNCPRDPNIKTTKDFNEVEKENKRVLTLKNHHKKRFSETQVVTAHMLKKCIKVPIIDDKFDKFSNPILV